MLITDSARLQQESAHASRIEAVDVAKFGGDAGVANPNPDALAKEAAAAASHRRGISVRFLVRWALAHGCFDWPTWRVKEEIIQPATEATRCRYTELPELVGTTSVGPADVFVR